MISCAPSVTPSQPFDHYDCTINGKHSVAVRIVGTKEIITQQTPEFVGVIIGDPSVGPQSNSGWIAVEFRLDCGRNLAESRVPTVTTLATEIRSNRECQR